MTAEIVVKGGSDSSSTWVHAVAKNCHLSFMTFRTSVQEIR